MRRHLTMCIEGGWRASRPPPSFSDGGRHFGACHHYTGGNELMAAPQDKIAKGGVWWVEGAHNPPLFGFHYILTLPLVPSSILCPVV